MSKKFHIVSHTHWDREWYFSTCDSLVLLDQAVTDILDELQKNPKANFTLDGQISIVEDYLKIRPEKLSVMKQLVDEGRLFVGPWYTQTDTQLISPQSIVNNMYYGIARTKELFNNYMKIGYLPDTFGFNNQMPMIVSQFGISNMIFWRGSDFNKQKIEPYFNWIAQDGSVVTSAILHNGYGMAKGFNTSELFIEKLITPLIEQYEDLSNSNDILIPVGNDQNNIVVNLDEKIKEVGAKIGKDLVISSYENFITSISSQDKPEYKGEFREVPYTRVHKTCGSIRYDIKHSNYKAEMALVHELDPLNAMAKYEGFEMSNRLSEEAWLKLFEGQAHDGMVGCVSDGVRDDIINRNKQAYEIASSTSNYLKKKFATALNLANDELLVFNTDPHEFSGYKEVQVFSHYQHIEFSDVKSQSVIHSEFYEGYENALVETPQGNYYEKEKDYYLHTVLIDLDLPSFGYRVLKYKESDETSKVEELSSISNELYSITYENGSVHLNYDGKIISDFIRLYDSGNTGDTYDYSPLDGEKEVALEIRSASCSRYNSVEIMNIDATVVLPFNLDERRESTHSTQCDASIEIQLRKGDDIRVSITFDNQVLNHRVRVRIKGFEEASKTLAATPFGSVRRDILNGKVDKDWETKCVEYPIDVETNSGFVAMSNPGKQLTIFNKGLKEYQADSTSIYMTLISGVDELGKPDLAYRPGRASGDTTKRGHIRMMTPKAQVLGKYTFELMISFTENDDQELYKKLQTYEALPVYYQLQGINLFYERIDNKIQMVNFNHELPKEKSYMTIHNDLIMSSIYISKIDNEVHVRAIGYKDIVDMDDTFRIQNLLEEHSYKECKAYRLYSLKENKDEN